MSKSYQELAERVARLEKEIEHLKSLLVKEPEKPWWEQIKGKFKGDKMFADAARTEASGHPFRNTPEAPGSGGPAAARDSDKKSRSERRRAIAVAPFTAAADAVRSLHP